MSMLHRNFKMVDR